MGGQTVLDLLLTMSFHKAYSHSVFASTHNSVFICSSCNPSFQILPSGRRRALASRFVYLFAATKGKNSNSGAIMDESHHLGDAVIGVNDRFTPPCCHSWQGFIPFQIKAFRRSIVRYIISSFRPHRRTIANNSWFVLFYYVMLQTTWIRALLQMGNIYIKTIILVRLVNVLSALSSLFIFWGFKRWFGSVFNPFY